MSSTADYPPWNRLVASAGSDERRMLFELQHLLTDAGLELHDFGRPADDWGPNTMTAGSYSRLMDLRYDLGRLGTWDRLGRLVEGYTAEHRAATGPGPQVQTLIVFAPTDDKEQR